MKPKLPRAPLPRQTGGAHRDARRPSRVNAKAKDKAQFRPQVEEFLRLVSPGLNFRRGNDE